MRCDSDSRGIMYGLLTISVCEIFHINVECQRDSVPRRTRNGSSCVQLISITEQALNTLVVRHNKCPSDHTHTHTHSLIHFLRCTCVTAIPSYLEPSILKCPFLTFPAINILPPTPFPPQPSPERLTDSLWQ